MGQDPSMLQSGYTPKSVYQDMWATILSGQRWTGDLINRRKDGTLYDAHLTIMPILDGKGNTTGFVSVQSDITRLKEVERLKTQFVTNVSHELRTPLTNIKTYLTLLERRREERKSHYLSVLNQETRRLSRLIQDLLNLSRLDNEKEASNLTPISLRATLQAMYEVFAVKMKKKGIHCRLVLPDVLAPVLVRKEHLEQLLSNLLTNALNYTQAGGAVNVEAGMDDSTIKPMVWMRVKDTGMGIPASELPQIYERFYRGQAAQRSGAPGTGLGLSIAKEIVDRYAGRIDVTSKVNEGTCFTVWLPAVNY